MAGPWTRWGALGAGLVVGLGLTLAPGSPFSAAPWPRNGPFGVFTWAACLVSASLAVLAGVASAALALRRRGGPVGAGLTGAGRLGLIALAFALLSLASFATAARADLIERNPAAALVPALALLVILRALTRAARRPGPSEAEADAPARRWPFSGRAPAAREISDGDDPDSEAKPEAPRWLRVLATGAAVLFVLVLGAGLAVRWLGPGLGLVLTAPRAIPIFWGETTFFEYDTARRAGSDVSAYFHDPEPGSTAAARRAVLRPGSRLAVKGWLDGGAEVRVERDPGGRLQGEWGYVRLGDVAE